MKKWKKNNKIACSTMVLVMLMAGLSGCIGSDDSEETLRIAFSVKDDYASPLMNTLRNSPTTSVTPRG